MLRKKVSLFAQIKLVINVRNYLFVVIS